jgi:CPA2 family monovalent cation:H+ antiporter-2
VNGFLSSALVFLAAAVLCVPLAKRLGLSSVLGYLLAGILIGPFVLGFVGHEGEDIMHVAEFGVVMMLFLIGLELEPSIFWEMRKTIVGLGLAQMALTTISLMIAGMLIFEMNWQVALAIAMAFSLSSTAIVIQSLKEKGLSNTVAGKTSFAVLIFQDISVIPILALIPILSAKSAAVAGTAHATLIGNFPSWLQALLVGGAVGSVYLTGRYLFVPFLRFISKTHLRELFTATSLLLVVAVAYLMELVGLSPALGAFIAGAVLANSEFRHELESNLEPFKGLLLGLFFIGVGAAINFRMIMEDPLKIMSWVFVIVTIKFIVIYLIGRFFKIRQDQNMLFAIGLSQVGEFAFVIFSFAGQLELVDAATLSKLMAVVTITMLITPLLLLANEKLIDPYFGVKTKEKEKEADTIDAKHKVMIIGFGHFGSTIGRLLRANGVEATILDNDSDRVELLRKMGFKVYYGDATRLDLLNAAGAGEATMLIAAIDSPEINKQLIEIVRKHFPNLRIFARARNRFDAYDLMEIGVEHIYRETLYTAVHLGVDVLHSLGFRKYSATRQGQKFIEYDERALSKLAASRHNFKEYVVNVRKEIELQEKLLQNDLHLNLTAADHSWDSQHVRELITGIKTDSNNQ